MRIANTKNLTAVLLSLRGARRVIALEPYPRLYGESLLNIKANDPAGRVTVYILTLTSQRPPGLKSEYPSTSASSAQTSPSVAPRLALTRVNVM